eukprot:gene10216-biopygen224
MARAWRGLQAIFGLGGAGVARAWRGRGAGMSCDPLGIPSLGNWGDRTIRGKNSHIRQNDTAAARPMTLLQPGQ